MAQLAKSWEGRIAAVTGASGAFGTFLVRDLVRLGARVRALDLRFDDHAGVYKEAGDKVEFIQGDVTKPSEALTEALKGVDVLFHTVAYFGFPAFARPEYAQPGNPEIMRKINVTSTSHLLDVCVEQGVKAFVFTASVNTMFVGEPMLGTTEDESYPPAEKYIDSYGPTKSEAERLVLAANGRGSLRTASVRPNGIWGPTDRCIAVVKAITQYASMGGLYFKFKGWDGKEPVTDWTHVDNLSRAEILAAEKCFEKDPKVCGSAYFVTDGDVQPITTWSIPLCRAAHLHVYPCIPVPVWMLPTVGRLSEQVCCLLRKLTGSKMAPMLGEMEALKASTSHYVCIDKAKKELGFEPKPYAKLMEEMAPTSVIVPSDVTVLEEKHKVGRRRLGLLEQTGLLCTMPMFHIHYAKMDRGDKRAVLSKKYDPEDTSSVVDILRRRQESVRKEVVSKNFLFGGAWAFAGMSYWSFRRYNYQSRLIAFPFLFYLGSFAGRMVGGVVTGKNAEYGRDQFLGRLPAKGFLPAPQE